MADGGGDGEPFRVSAHVLFVFVSVVARGTTSHIPIAYTKNAENYFCGQMKTNESDVDVNGDAETENKLQS